MPRENILDVAGVFRYVPGPVTEAAVCIDGVYPLIEEPTFGPVPLTVLTLGFENKVLARFKRNYALDKLDHKMYV